MEALRDIPTQPSGFRNDFVAAILEFVGTVLFLVLGLGGIQTAAYSSTLATAATMTQSPTKAAEVLPRPSIDQLFYVSLSMGFSLLTVAWMFYRVTGAVFNPQVAFALWLVGAIKYTRLGFYIVAQLTGGIVASVIVKALSPGIQAYNVSLTPGVSKVQGIFIEAIITGALVTSVLMLAVEKHRSTAFAPIGIGLTLFIGHLFGVVYTGAATNSARAFGPAVINGFSSDHWVYWVGPSLGSIVSVAVYITVKHFKYHQHLNPYQDETNDQHSADPFTSMRAFAGAFIRKTATAISERRARSSSGTSAESSPVSV